MVGLSLSSVRRVFVAGFAAWSVAGVSEDPKSKLISETKLPFCAQMQAENKLPPVPACLEYNDADKVCRANEFRQLRKTNYRAQRDALYKKFLTALKAKHLERMDALHPAKLTEGQKQRLFAGTLKSLRDKRVFMALMGPTVRRRMPKPGLPVAPDDFQIRNRTVESTIEKPNEELSDEEVAWANRSLARFISERFDEGKLPNAAASMSQKGAEQAYAQLVVANPFLLYVKKAKPSSADLESHFELFKQDYSAQRKDLSEIPIDGADENTLKLYFAALSSIDEVAADNPMYCHVVASLAERAMRVHKAREQTRNSLALAGAVGCLFSGPFAIYCEGAVGVGYNGSIAWDLFNDVDHSARNMVGIPMDPEERVAKAEDPDRKLNIYSSTDPFDYLALFPAGLLFGTGKRLGMATRLAAHSLEGAGISAEVKAAKLAGRCVSHGPECLEAIEFSEQMYAKVKVHEGWTPEQRAYLEKILPEIQVAKEQALLKGESFTERDLAYWLQKKTSRGARHIDLADNSVLPFRAGKITSVFPEGASPASIAREIAEGRAVLTKVENGSDVNHLYNYERIERGKPVTYQIYTCSQPSCEAAGRTFKSGEVISIYPCGDNVQSIMSLSMATKVILASDGPVSADQFMVPGKSRCLP